MVSLGPSFAPSTGAARDGCTGGVGVYSWAACMRGLGSIALPARVARPVAATLAGLTGGPMGSAGEVSRLAPGRGRVSVVPTAVVVAGLAVGRLASPVSAEGSAGVAVAVVAALPVILVVERTSD